ncbi:extracellular solute-binding protein [Jatrophihabitans sp. YIM 134969]
MPRASHRTRLRALVAVAAATVVATTLAACGGGSDGGSGGGGSLSIVGYSIAKGSYDALEKGFQGTDAGKGVTFTSSFGASGDQSRAVQNGQKADLVNFSIEPDMTRLVPDLVADDWNAGDTKGIISETAVVIVVRPGNPKGIKGWDDLIKSGVGVVTPDPGSSGSAKWNILAAYAHAALASGSEDQAAGEDYLKKLYANIVSKPESGSKATQTFLSGTGDVLLSYEAEAIATKAKGQDLDYIVPSDTLSIQTPGAVTKDSGDTAKAFLDYCLSADGQKIFGENGFRPMGGATVTNVQGANDPANPYPAIETLHTVDDLGGWGTVDDKFFGDDGIVTKIAAASS